jgi:hypothetical protein
MGKPFSLGQHYKIYSQCQCLIRVLSYRGIGRVTRGGGRREQANRLFTRELARVEAAFKAPNPKLQAPKKLQAPNIKIGGAIDWSFGVWNFSGAWCLKFGASSLSSMRPRDLGTITAGRFTTHIATGQGESGSRLFPLFDERSLLQAIPATPISSRFDHAELEGARKKSRAQIGFQRAARHC